MKCSLLQSFAVLLLISGCGQQEPQVIEEYVHCRSLAGDRTAVNLFAWEFNALSEELKSNCPIGEELTAAEIASRVEKQLPEKLRDSLPDPKSSIETTLLELEVRGIFTKVTNDKGDALLRRTM